MKLRLPDSISSLQDLSNLLIEIKSYARWYNQHKILKQLDSKKITDSPNLSPAASELVNDLGPKDKISQQDIDELLSTLEKFQSNTPHLNITLAAPPTNDIKRTLVNWCRQNIAPNVLVTFQFNATILGGMVIRHGSHIYDWSFRRQILAARGNFCEVLRRV